MRIRHVLVVAGLAAWCGGASAQDTGAGAGVLLGNALGLSAKLWHTPELALAGGLGGSLEGDRSLVAHVDYVIHGDGALRRLAYFREARGDGRFLLYYGGGLRLQVLDRNRLGVRVPVGLDYLFGRAPWDAFLEVAPVLDLVSGVRLRLNAAIGLRYFPPLPGQGRERPQGAGAGRGRPAFTRHPHRAENAS